MNFSIFYLLFLLYIRGIELLNFYSFEYPPENHLSVIGRLLENILNNN